MTTWRVPLPAELPQTQDRELSLSVSGIPWPGACSVSPCYRQAVPCLQIMEMSAWGPSQAGWKTQSHGRPCSAAPLGETVCPVVFALSFEGSSKAPSFQALSQRDLRSFTEMMLASCMVCQGSSGSSVDTPHVNTHAQCMHTCMHTHLHMCT